MTQHKCDGGEINSWQRVVVSFVQHLKTKQKDGSVEINYLGKYKLQLKQLYHLLVDRMSNDV